MKKRLILGVVLCILFANLFADEYKYALLPGANSGGTVVVTDNGNGTFTLEARPSDGWEFAQWSDATTTNPYVNFTPTGNTYSLQAEFTDRRLAAYTKSKTTDPTKGGTVSVSKGICDADWTLIAKPDTVNGWTFLGWSDDGDDTPDGNTSKSRDVTIDLSKDTFTYKAIFEEHICTQYHPKYNTPTEGGSVTATQPSGYCECVWKITATPDAGWTFIEWNDHSTVNPRDITIDKNSSSQTYTATFVPTCSLNEPEIASVTGLGTSTVTQPDPSCVCSWQLSVTPASGYTFQGWDDDGNGTIDNTQNPRTVVSDADGVDTYTPVFVLTCSLNTPVIANATGLGTRTVAPTANDCEWTLTVSPASSYTFAGWDDNGDGIVDGGTANPRTVNSTASGVDTYTPVFVLTCSLNTPVIANATGLGTRTVAPTANDCEWTLTVSSASSYTFVGWDDDGDGIVDGGTANPRTVNSTASGVDTYTPVFVLTCSLNTPVIANATGLGTRTVAPTANDCEWTLTVTAADDYTFNGWSDSNTDNPRTVNSTASGVDTYTPTFVKTCTLYTPVIANVDGVAESLVEPTGNECEWSLSITADAEHCYTFEHWSDLSSGDADYAANPRIVVATTSGAGTYTPVFSQATCNYKFNDVVGTSGTVTAVKTSECDCEWSVTATPADGWEFDHWSDLSPGDADYAANPRIVSLSTESGSFVAVFNDRRLAAYTKSSTTDPSKGGTVSVSKGACDGEWTLTATPDEVNGWTFLGWDDDGDGVVDGGNASPRDIKVNLLADTFTYKAIFEEHIWTQFHPKYNNPVTGGTVAATQPDGYCEYVWKLTATPTSGYSFVEWNDHSTVNPRDITIDKNVNAQTYAATFVPTCSLNEPVIDDAVGLGTSTVTRPDAGCVCSWQLAVTPASGYTFQGWDDDGSAPATRTVVSDDDGVDHYIPIFALTCSFNTPVIANVTGLATRTVAPTANDCEWTLSVTAETGYTFAGWDDNGDGIVDGGTANPRTVESGAVVATYTPIFEDHRCLLYTPTVTSPVTGGTAAGAVTGDECVWHLTATPTEGYIFVKWLEDDNTNAERDITINPLGPSATYTPVFEDHRCTLYTPVIANATGLATRTVAPTVNECEWTLTVTADAEHCYTFVEWSDHNTDNPRTVTTTNDQGSATTYTPVFSQATCNYKFDAVVGASGTVTAVMTNECACQWSVTATPADGWEFDHWSDLSPGDADYAANPRTVSLSTDAGSFVAVFTDHRVAEYSKYKATNPVSGGTVSAAQGVCDGEWVLTATPNAVDGWVFLGWDDDGDGVVDGGNASPRDVTIDLSKDTFTYKAIFEDHVCSQFEAKYNNPAEGGTVSAAAGTCACDWILTATPTEGYAFLQWNDCNYLNPRPIEIDKNAGPQTYTAHFIASDAYIDSWTATDIVVGTKKQDLTPTDATIYINGVAIDAAHTDQDPDPVTGEHGLWTLPGGLNDHAGEQISIIFYDDATGLPVSVVTGTVPYISTGDKSFNTILPPLPENTDVEVVSGTLTFDDDEPMVLGALTVHPDAKAVVPEFKDVTFTHIYMLGNGPEKKYPQLVANGTIHNLNSDTIYYDYTLDYASFYPLAVPYDVTCAKIRTKSGKAASYEVQWYNGEDRAANAHAWTVFDDQAVGATLRAGTGYIVFAVPYKWNGTRHATVDVRFPMVAPLTTPETEKSTPVSLYGGEGTSASNKNWNLVGNPYLANYTTSDDARLLVGTYEPGISTSDNEKYEYNNDGVRYITMTTDGYQTYQQQRADEGVTIKAFTNFFIQSASTGDLVFTLSQRAQNAPRRKASRAESEELRELAFGIVLKAADQSDRTGLLYGEDFTEAYEMNADLVKMSGSTPVLELYSLVGNEKRAFNALHMTAIRTLVPLGYTNAPMGQMTIAFDYDHYDASALEAVMLTDYETGRVVNLLEQDYTFTNHAAHSDNRLAINAVVLPKTPEVATELNDQMVNGVYDLLGRKVTLENLPQGVYIIIENGQSRKEVIR